MNFFKRKFPTALGDKMEKKNSLSQRKIVSKNGSPNRKSQITIDSQPMIVGCPAALNQANMSDASWP